MVWYKPWTWFKKESKDEVIIHTDSYDSFPSRAITMAGKALLHCDNPSCDLPILEGPVMYDAVQKEIYHSGECAEQAIVLRTFKSGEISVGNCEAIGLEDAIKLFEAHKLKQALSANKELI